MYKDVKPKNLIFFAAGFNKFPTAITVVLSKKAKSAIQNKQFCMAAEPFNGIIQVASDQKVKK